MNKMFRTLKNQHQSVEIKSYSASNWEQLRRVLPCSRVFYSDFLGPLGWYSAECNNEFLTLVPLSHNFLNKNPLLAECFIFDLLTQIKRPLIIYYVG